MRRLALMFGVLVLVADCRLPGSPGPSTRVALPWRVLSSSPTSAAVQLETFRGACDHEQTPKVVAETDRVTITLWVLRDPGDCTAQAIAWRPTITLDQPLGSRRLVPG